VNLGWLLARIALSVGILSLITWSQVFWYRAAWRWTARWGSKPVRIAARLAVLALAAMAAVVMIDNARMGRANLIPHARFLPPFVGLWFLCAFLGFLAVKSVRIFDVTWRWAKRRLAPAASEPQAGSQLLVVDAPQDPSRRYFFKTATAAAGAAPFIGAVYGFAAERLNYQIHRVEIPISNLPEALDGLTITQLSDIHMSGYMPRAQVHRAVDMANDLGGDLAVVTGDFITAQGDPLEECIEEIRRLSAPLGIYGCNGNHEIYAEAEDRAQQLFAQSGMKLLRRENAAITFRGAQLNLIGVDYQRERSPGGRKMMMLSGLESLVRTDAPNILLSHNPNSFNRAAELGIELSLAGHTHGGQIQVEILDHRLSPARFITDYVAGLYIRPLFTPSRTVASQKFLQAATLQGPHSAIYVNRGLGTVGAPVRFGVPPEISLLTLRRA
jgi:uncharacterized protein